MLTALHIDASSLTDDLFFSSSVAIPTAPYSLREALVVAGESTADTVHIHLESDARYEMGRQTFPPQEDLFFDAFFGDFDIGRDLVIHGNNATIDANDLSRIFELSGSIDVTINDLTLRDGQVHWDNNGGAIAVRDGVHLTLNNVNLRSNLAFGQGGALYADNPNGSITINGGSFRYNDVDAGEGDRAYGGAIAIEGGTELTVSDTIFEANDSRAADTDNPVNAYGGAISIRGSQAIIQKASFSSNRSLGGDSKDDGSVGSDSYGGAIFHGGGSGLSVTDTIFKSNVSRGGSGFSDTDSGDDPTSSGSSFGGAIFVSSSAIETEITRTLFGGNESVTPQGGSGEDGGARAGLAAGGALAMAYIYDGPERNTAVNFYESLFEFNLAEGGAGGSSLGDGDGGRGGSARGGAVYATEGRLNLIDTTFLSNQALAGRGGNAKSSPGHGGDGQGGAVYTTSGHLNIQGAIIPGGPTDNPDSVAIKSAFNKNAAEGGNGGRKHASLDAYDSDSAGDGGNAYGGAIYASSVDTTASFDIHQTVFGGNAANAGNGGRGDRPDDSVDYVGTAGGDNGSAYGGALYGSGTIAIDESLFTSNSAVAGRVGDEDFVAFSAGAGGHREDHYGLRGGNGGDAFGGAIFHQSGDLLIEDSYLSLNAAYGSAGGAGSPGRQIDEDDQAGPHGGNGGSGGDAFGGAIRSTAGGKIELTGSILAQNKVIAGRGGNGGKGARSGPAADDVSGYGGAGGLGGRGGDAGGAGLSTDGANPDVLLTDVQVTLNKVAAGDGGIAGNGGAGATWGGVGLSSGPGGDATGGGVHLDGADATIQRSTIDKNVASSGWGQQGAYGGPSQWGGGIAGNGGDAGDSLGGGVASLSGELLVTHSTVADNEAIAGNGGNGGISGSSKLGVIEDGGAAGDGGSAKGGGIYSHADLSFLSVVSSTVARNAVTAGQAGFQGGLGRDLRHLNVGIHQQPLTYSAAPGHTLSNGAASVFHADVNDTSADGELQLSTIDTISNIASDLGVSEASLESVLVDSSLTVAVPTAAFAAGTAVGTVALLPTLLVKSGGAFMVTLGPEIASSATASSLSFATGGLGGVAATAGASFGIGAAILSIGAIVLGKALYVGIQSGDWEGAFQYALGGPGDVNGLSLGVLINGGPIDEGYDEYGPPDPDSYPAPQLGPAGADGVSEGQNIHGAGVLKRSIVAAGATINRTRTKEFTPANDATGEDSKYLISETVTTSTREDVSGLFLTDGANLIGAHDGSNFNADMHGTTANPLDPLLNPDLLYNGGSTPTLSLLPHSPARGAVSIAGADSSQNAYAWDTVADIGSWGGGVNRPPVAVDDSYTIVEGSAITIPFRNLASNDVDPDNDPLRVTAIDYVAENGDIEPTLIMVDGEFVITGITYTPDPDFVGEETISYKVNDSEYSRQATLTIHVSHLNDAPTFVAQDVFVEPDSGAHSIGGWAVFDAGDPNESDQLVLRYNVDNVTRPELFSELPTIDVDGTLRFDVADGVAGAVSFDVTVQDDGGVDFCGHDTSSVQTFSIEIGDANNPPHFVASAPPAVLEDAGSVVIESWAAFDAGNPEENNEQSVHQYLVNVSEPQLFAELPTVSNDGTLSYRFADDAFGTASIEVAVQDDGGTNGLGVDTSETQVFQLQALPVNDAPGLTVQHTLYLTAGLTDTELTVPDFAAFLPQNAFEADQSLSYQTAITQIGASSLLPTVTPDGALHLTFPRLVGPNPTIQSGSLLISASDDGGTDNGGHDQGAQHIVYIFLSHSHSFNNAPQFSASDVNVDEDAGPTVISDWATFSPGFNDEGSGQVVEEYVVEAISRPELFDPADLPHVNQDGDLIFTPAPDAFGETTITVSVRDDGEATRYDDQGRGNDQSISKTFRISITPANDAPSFVAQDVVTVKEDSGTHQVTGWVSDFLPDGDPQWSGTETPLELGYQLSNYSNASLFSSLPTVDASGNLQFTVAPNAYGTSTFEVIATDSDESGFSQSAPQTFEIAVEPVNDRPELIAEDPPAGLEDAFEHVIEDWFAYSPGPANEAGQTPVGVAVSNISNPGLFAVPPTVGLDGTLRYRLAHNAVGESSFEATVQDNGGDSGGGSDTSLPQVFTIRSNPVNDAPDVTAPERVTVDQNSGLQQLPQWANFTPGPSDEASQSVVVSTLTVNHPEYFSVQPSLSADGTLSFMPAEGAHGIATIGVIVQDDGGKANGGVDSSPLRLFEINIEPLAPEVESIVIDDGTGQRSIVKSVTVNFKNGVTVDEGAFHILNTTTNQTFATSVVLSQDGTKATLTFSGMGIIGGSLSDGNYELSIDKDKVHAGDKTLASDRVDEFFRYFGDHNGDRDVDAIDFRVFKSSYRTQSIDDAYERSYDYDGDGDVDSRDFRALRSRYRTSLAANDSAP